MAARLAFPDGYYVVPRRDSYELHLDGYGLIAADFDCEAHAIHYAEERQALIDEEEREAAENAAEWTADDLREAA